MINNVYMVDYNSKGSLKEVDLPVRKYPRIFPVPDTVINKNSQFIFPFNIENIELYPEFYGVIDEKEKINYSVGFAVWTDQLIKNCNSSYPRDIIVNNYYGYYFDNTKIINSNNKNLIKKNVRDYVIKLNIFNEDDENIKMYDMSKLLFNVEEIINEMKRFLKFHKGDLICLGRVGKGIIINKNIINNIIKINIKIPEIITRSIVIKKGV